MYRSSRSHQPSVLLCIRFIRHEALFGILKHGIIEGIYLINASGRACILIRRITQIYRIFLSRIYPDKIKAVYITVLLKHTQPIP